MILNVTVALLILRAALFSWYIESEHKNLEKRVDEIEQYLTLIDEQIDHTTRRQFLKWAKFRRMLDEAVES